MQIKENLSLKSWNTFGIDVKARYFAECTSVDDIVTLLADDTFSRLPLVVLGGGSNILFTDDVQGVVLKMDMQDIRLIGETDTTVILEADAGVDWDSFVQHAVSNHLSGVENLALIPGTCGASPIQNIGAYGVEVKDVIYRVDALNRETIQREVFINAACKFGYRDSIFKRESKDRYIILSVQYQLQKQFKPNIKYGAIRQELDAKGVDAPSMMDVYQAVCAIRQSKLPDPKEMGNAGSFFKNPYISNEQYLQLKSKHPDIVAYAEQDRWKIAAGWLIEQCGLKGYRSGDAGVHTKQALVLVNYGSATGQDILALANKVQQMVLDTFGITIEMEVNIK